MRKIYHRIQLRLQFLASAFLLSVSRSKMARKNLNFAILPFEHCHFAMGRKCLKDGEPNGKIINYGEESCIIRANTLGLFSGRGTCGTDVIAAPNTITMGRRHFSMFTIAAARECGRGLFFIRPSVRQQADAKLDRTTAFLIAQRSHYNRQNQRQ